MSASVKKIQSALSFCNDRLFDIRDITSIISFYAVSFISKLIQRKPVFEPHELRINNGTVVCLCNSRKMLTFFNLSANGLLKETLKYNLHEHLFAFEVHKNQILTLPQCTLTINMFTVNHPSQAIQFVRSINVDGEALNSLSDVVIDSKNNCFYALTQMHVHVFDSQTMVLKEKHLLVLDDAVEICLSSHHNLLFVRSMKKIVAHHLPSFQPKFHLDSNYEFNSICTSDNLNSLIVATFNEIKFYSLVTGDLIGAMKLQEGLTSRGMVFDSETGFLILSDPFESQSLLLFE
jgi:hypothetical protein